VELRGSAWRSLFGSFWDFDFFLSVSLGGIGRGWMAERAVLEEGNIGGEETSPTCATLIVRKLT